MKTPLTEIEQNNLRLKGILGHNEMAYQENNCVYAVDVLTNNSRVIDVRSNSLKENKNILFG